MMMVPLKAGDSLDHYHIEALAVRTSLTTIYRATDTRDGRLVAIKIPHPELECDPVFFSRFKREGEIGRKLNHPGVVKTIADDDVNQVCLVMEWVDGRFLRQILGEQGTLPPERAVRIVVGICDALEYIHTQGIVHRDLKPENIMVDAEDCIKLIDFGIAASAGARRLTFSGFSNPMGTPDYISPEQVDGKRGDARSDVYALGVMLYEMLTGQMPFHGPSPFAIMNARLRTYPVPPREINPEITPEMQEIIFRALERDPNMRYASAREFDADLEHPEKVDADSRKTQREAKLGSSPERKMTFVYVALAMIPAVIFAFLLYVAHKR